MAYSNYENNEKNSFEQNIGEENVILTLVPVNEEPIEEYEIETTISSTAEVKPRRRRAPPILPLPTTLPPINEVHRDTLRNWCQQCKLSTDGQKIAVYQRLQKYAFFDSSQSVSEIPETTRMRPRPRSRKHTTEDKKARIRKSCQMNEKKRDTSNIVEVTSTAQEAMLAAWGRITARASQPKATLSHPVPSSVETFLPQATGIRWCIVHGRPLSADTEGWVRLQFHVGQVWVPNTPRRMIPLFLLPACTFSTPDLEDNLLCPECVKRNKKMMRRLITGKKEKQPDSNTPTPFLDDEEMSESP
ncbi:developmental pluripotency-associated protein 2 [Erinaceus europaeus]|uniref:Developmental pluripotency-associated protein 2 n=1 Tax=Erinaceus europaeus TaxID=9365 RepID=A0A1S3AQI5_ERIEU|nr:developmental pluripotency-associated protein 2 [Erinaceus europaeus]